MEGQQEGDGVTPRVPGGGPVYFLVREHAKVLLSIQELQEKVAALEELRSTVEDLERKAMSLRSVSPCHQYSWSKQRLLKNFSDTQLINSAVPSQVASPSKRDHESDKQDSGLESDCRDPRSSGLSDARSPTTVPNILQRSSNLSKMEDELLNLLECIEERSHTLRDQVVRMEHESLNVFSRLDDDLRLENQKLKQRLLILENEKDKSFRQLQAQLHRLTGEKLALEDRLQTSQFEKLQLENHVRELHLSCIRSLGENPADEGQLSSRSAKPEWNTPSTSQGEGLNRDPLMERIGDEASEEVRAKANEILRQNNLPELKRQLMFYLMENDVLHKKLDRVERTWLERLQDWKTSKSSLKSDIEHLILERDSYIGALKKSHQENRLLRGRLKMYANALNEAGPSETTASAPVKTRNFSSYLDQHPPLPQTFHGGFADNYPDHLFRATSLPPLMVNQAQNEHLEGSSLIDIPQHDVPTGPASFYADVDDLTSCASSSSDRVVYRAPWQQRVQAEQHLMNLDEPSDEKGSQHSSELNDICTEFDPLMSSEPIKSDDTQDPNKPMDFVDSLDLSVPLAPSKLLHHDNLGLSSNSDLRRLRRALSSTKLDSAHSNYASSQSKGTPYLYRSTRTLRDA